MSASGGFDVEKKVQRAGSSEPISPTMPRRNVSAEGEPKKRTWRKSLDHSVLHVSKGAARTRTGSWNHSKERDRKTRDKPSVVSASTKRGDTASPTMRARVVRSGSLPADKVSDGDSWKSLDREAEEMAAGQRQEGQGMAFPSIERLPIKEVRRKSDVSQLSEELSEEEPVEEESVVKIRADAKSRVKHRKRGGTPRGQDRLELDLSALLEKGPSEGKAIAFEGQEEDPVSPRRKVGRTTGGGFLSARGLDSIQIRKKTLNLTNNLTARSQAKSKPTRRTSSPSVPESDEPQASDPLQTASWEGASPETLERRATKRERVLMELLMTERKFVSVLAAVVQFVLSPMRSNSILAEEEVETIFANIEDIFQLNQSLLCGMEACMGKKRRRTGSKLARKLSPTFAARPEHIPPDEPLPKATLEKLVEADDECGPVVYSLASSAPSSPRVPNTMDSCSPREGPASPRSFDSTSSSPRTHSSHASPLTPRTPRTPTSPRSPRSPPGSPMSPSKVPLTSGGLPTVPSIPSSPEANATRALPAPGSPAPAVPRTADGNDWAAACTSLGQLFMAYSKRMSIHTEFCSNHSRLLAEKKLKKMREDNPGLARFLEV